MTSFQTFELSTPESQSNRRNLITSLHTSQLSTPESQRNKRNMMTSFQTSQLSTPVVALRAPSLGIGAPSELVFT